MKKNRFLALTAALALCLSLAAPVRAAEPAPEPVLTLAPAQEQTGLAGLYDEFTLNFAQQYKAQHPEEFAAFDAQAWYDQEWSYLYDSQAEYMEAMGLSTQEEFETDMWTEYVTQTTAAYGEALRSAEVETYRSAHPGELEALDLDQVLWALGYRDPMESYMSDMGLDSRAAAETSLLAEYVSARHTVEETHIEAEMYRADDPAGWESFNADSYYAENMYYYGSKEEYMAQHFLRTDTEFKEAVYCRSVYFSHRLDWEWGVTPAGPTLTVNGENREMSITVENGVSYAPAEELNALLGTSLTGEKVSVRAAAQEAGWGVTWNRWNNQVVLLDKARLTQGAVLPTGEEVQWNFDQFDRMMNRLLSSSKTQEGQSYRTTETCNVTLTAFNSLDGDQTYTARVTVDILQRDNTYDMTLTVNAADLLRMLSQQTMDKLSAEMPKVTFQNLKTLLGGVKLNAILDLDQGKLYWNLPILASFSSQVKEDAWYALDLGLGQSTEMWKTLTQGEWNTAEFLYEMLLESSANDYYGAGSSYEDFVEMGVVLQTLIGPESMSEQGGTLTWKLDTQSIARMAAAIQGYGVDPLEAEQFQKELNEVLSVFKEYHVSVSVSEGGRFTCQAAIRLDMDALAGQIAGSEYWDAAETAAITWVMNLLDFRMTAQSSGTANKASGTAQFHWKNQFQLDLKTDSARTATNSVPRSAPPAGVQVVEL